MSTSGLTVVPPRAIGSRINAVAPPMSAPGFRWAHYPILPRSSRPWAILRGTGTRWANSSINVTDDDSLLTAKIVLAYLKRLPW